MKLAMIIDKRRCTGCLGCVVACKQANSTAPGTFWAKIDVNEHGTFPNAFLEYMPRLCNHCDDAPCVAVCPTGASKKMADGTVQIDADACIGCKSCMDACPYDVRTYNEEGTATYWTEHGKQDFYEQKRFVEHKSDTVEKCTFCERRRAEGIRPACVMTCAPVARTFGDLDDPDSEVSKVYNKYKPKGYKPEEGTKPRVFYIE
jgi:molybdopterin-containing oxidoreductase family iron-sulfur binding subunit